MPPKNPIRSSDTATYFIAFGVITAGEMQCDWIGWRSQLDTWLPGGGVKQYQATCFRLSWHLDTCAEYVTRWLAAVRWRHDRYPSARYTVWGCREIDHNLAGSDKTNHTAPMVTVRVTAP